MGGGGFGKSRIREKGGREERRIKSKIAATIGGRSNWERTKKEGERKKEREREGMIFFSHFLQCACGNDGDLTSAGQGRRAAGITEERGCWRGSHTYDPLGRRARRGPEVGTRRGKERSSFLASGDKRSPAQARGKEEEEEEDSIE